MKKNGFLTFMCACVPGCGQMYQGYMKRGLSLLAWFIAVIVVSILTRIYVLCLILPVIWAYSFFDAFNIRALTPEQRAAFADGLLPAGLWQNSGAMKRWAAEDRNSRIIGWACVAIGALIVLGLVWDMVLNLLWTYFPAAAEVVRTLPSLLVAALVILLGVRLLRGGRPAARDEDDINYSVPAPVHTTAFGGAAGGPAPNAPYTGPETPEGAPAREGDEPNG